MKQFFYNNKKFVKEYYLYKLNIQLLFYDKSVQTLNINHHQLFVINFELYLRKF